MVKLNIGLFGKKKPKEEAKKERKEEPKAKSEMPIVYREVNKATAISERYKITPKIIFVGSGKGGVGKSFIASNLTYIVAAHSKNRPVYAVDLDLDNSTLSMVLPPPDVYDRLKRALAQTEIKYLNVADILDEGVVEKSRLFSFAPRIFTCGGTQITPEIRLIPSYHTSREKSQKIKLKSMDALRLREGLESLIDYLQQKNSVAVLDGKQKSNLSPNFDPLYRIAKERADVILLVTEPPYLSFSSITAQYNDMLNKLIIVVNKMVPSYEDQLVVLLSDAMRYNVPVFVVPSSDEDSFKYKEKFTPPAERLSSKTSVFIGAIALYLNLIDNCDTKCCNIYEEILSKEVEVMRIGKR